MPNFAEQSVIIAQEEAPQTPPRDSLERRAFRVTAVVLATLVGAYVLWLLVDLLLLLFACGLASLILLSLTNIIRTPNESPFRRCAWISSDRVGCLHRRCGRVFRSHNSV